MNMNLVGRRSAPLLTVSVFLTVFAVAQSNAKDPVGDASRQILSSDQPFRKVMVHEGGILVQASRSTTILRYNLEGAITGGADISTVDTEPTRSGERSALYDVALGPDGGVWALVGAVHPETRQISTYIFKYPDLSNPPAVVRISKAVAAFKLAVDPAGDVYLLGLEARDFHRMQEAHLGGEYEVLHKFSGEGEFLGSYLPIPIDAASDESISRSFVSPIYQAGNFAVDAGGNVWIVWFGFPREHESLKQIPSEVYRVDTVHNLVDRPSLPPPAPGAFVSGVLQDQGRVLIEWRTLEPGTYWSFLTSVTGGTMARGTWRGRVVGMLGNEVLTTAVGVIVGKRSLLREPLAQ